MQTIQQPVNADSDLQSSSDCACLNESCTQAVPTARNENVIIAERLRAGDPQMIDELIHRYQQRLLGYLVRLTGDRELAKDLLQETWIRVLTRGSQFRGDAQFTTWLYSVARNLVRDLRRRQPRPGSMEGITEEWENRTFEIACKEKNPFDYCAGTEHARLLRDALQELLPQHREIVELRFQREMSLGEIALVTGSSLSSVKTKLYRAMRLLRIQLDAMLSSQQVSARFVL